MAITADRFTFHCTWCTDAKLPAYLGSTLRGSLGWALKQCSCTLRQNRCHFCPLRLNCAYAWIFETEEYNDDTGLVVNARPHPFVIDSSGIEHAGSRIGDKFHFSILLLGDGIGYLPQIAHSVKIIGASGLGAGRAEGLGRFNLDSITDGGGGRVYSRNVEVLGKPSGEEKLSLGNFHYAGARGVSVRLLTPLRVKRASRLSRDLPFHVLVRSALRRVTALEHAYNGGEPDLDYKGLVAKAGKVLVAQSSLRWRDLLRYSNRQKSKVSLGGLLGSVQYSGDVAEFLPILKYCEFVNLGKQTAFGLGKICVSVEPLPE